MAPDDVLAGFGAPAGESVRGGPREAEALVTARSGYRPVVRAVPVGDWVVAVEERSHEGVRPEVLRRLSPAGRAASVGKSADGMRWLGFGENGAADRVETASAGAPGDREWDTLRDMADRAGVSLTDWAAEDLPASSLRFVAAVCGFAVDDAMRAEGLLGVVLPVLPPIVHAPGTPWATALRSVPDAELAAVATRHTTDLLTGCGVDGRSAVPAAVLAAATGTAPPATDDAPLGLALRELIAQGLVAVGAAADPDGPRLSSPERVALRRQAETGRVAHALLAGGPRAAILTMLDHSRSLGLSRRQLLAELGLADQADARRARSIPVDTSDLDVAPRRMRAVRVPPTRPASRGRRDDQT